MQYTAWKYDGSKSLTYRSGQKNGSACFADKSCLHGIFSIDSVQIGDQMVKQQQFVEIATFSGRTMKYYSDLGVCGLRYVPEAEKFDFEEYKQNQGLYDQETSKFVFNKFLKASIVYGVGYEAPLVNNLNIKQQLFGYWIRR
ncbi:unnamed protein product [Didymodactylos carnosus]|uniref:Peptidase A1 domain-containing protein n=1 Tax=Didymodactylos carnosus TaxID=1234261 RepID=A0A8S2JGZ8_9BILA|nr:unnamed protein product [Didymodactylos carnosus]CAF3810638.1 unnamed protein product [Didymodactylos carnosus]